MGPAWAGQRGGGSALQVQLTPQQRGKIERSADASQGGHGPVLSPKFNKRSYKSYHGKILRGGNTSL